MPPRPFLTSARWTLDGLISKGCRFLEIPRVSVSDKNLEVIIRAHESSGVPLVIDGIHEHRAWPATIFNTQWLCDNVQKSELCKVVRYFGCGDPFLPRNSGQKMRRHLQRPVSHRTLGEVRGILPQHSHGLERKLPRTRCFACLMMRGNP